MVAADGKGLLHVLRVGQTVQLPDLRKGVIEQLVSEIGELEAYVRLDDGSAKWWHHSEVCPIMSHP